MTKLQFIEYISKDNIGFYKTRKNHIKNIAPNILQEIENHIKKFNLIPINFNDALYYYLNNVIVQNTCKICNKSINLSSQYCSNACKKSDIKFIINKTQQTLFNKNGSISPLGSKNAKLKKKQTSLKKYGKEHPSSNENIKNKIKDTNINTYKDPNIRNKLSASIKNAHNKNHDDIVKKIKQTNFEKTGEYTTLTSDSIKKIKKTLKEKYDTINPFLIHDDTYKKAGESSTLFFSIDENKQKSINKRTKTNLIKYGGDPNHYPLFIERRKHKTKEKIQSKIDDKILNYDNFGILTCLCNKYQHEYKISTTLLNSRLRHKNVICTICNIPINYFQSSEENELYNFISKYISCQQNNKKLLPKFEADILIEDKKLIFEFNGIYWHSDIYKGKNYHQIKTSEFKKIGYKVIHIWEDLWYDKKEIIYDKIKHLLELSEIKIGARNCVIEAINTETTKNFLNENHIQGFNKSCFYNVGLFYNNELVYVISLSRRKFLGNKDSYELLRVCCKLNYTIIGGFTKLFNHILIKYPGNYISYADLSWGEGNMYKHAGFKLKGYTKPNYWYIIDNHRYHRYTYRKSELVKRGYDKNKTEFQIMDNDIKALRIYDCGNAVWEYKNI